MRVTLLIGVTCMVFVVTQTEGATTSREDQATEAPSTQSAVTKASQDKMIQKKELKKKLAEKYKEIAKNNKPLTDEEMKKGKDLLTNGPKQRNMTLEQLKKEEEEAEKEREEADLLDLVEGDEIIEDDEQGTRKKRNALSDKDRLWPDPSKIPYVLDKNFGDFQRVVIAAAIQQFNMYTCIRFVPRKDEIKYIALANCCDCTSELGMASNAGSQGINLADSCLSNPSTVQHEFMHTLGFGHEHNRPDRDQYVTINKNNLYGGDLNFFDLNAQGNVQSTKYDYLSVMHYGKDAMGKLDEQGNLMLTIVPKDPTYLDQIGRRQGFSQLDVDEINMLYCGGKKNVTVKPLCWNELGNCHEYLGWCKDSKILPKCMYSCNQCSDPPGKIPCGDYMSNCKDQVNQCMWSKTTREHCRATCNQCSDPPGPLPCGDHLHDCSDRAKYCNDRSNVGEYITASHYCPKTCNTCPKTTATKR